MDRQMEKRLSDRAVAIGREGDISALPELLDMLGSTSAQVRRLSVSAIGKLAGLADSDTAVNGLIPLLRDSHPQVRQYAVKALKAYGADAKSAMPDLRDLLGNPLEKEYNHRDAKLAIELIEEALRIREKQAEHKCQKCGVKIEAEEYARSIRAFQREYCDHCFDETYLSRRNYDTQVELNKTIRASDGTLVQSDGERIISEWLAKHGIKYRYDERIRIIEGYTVRPDFYLPEFDIYIEYWGMDTLDYKIGMLKKQKVYQMTEKKLISLYAADKPNLTEILKDKLSKYMRFT